ncbi:PEP-CTERM sorting domain-containing protein [Aquabacterium sp.]|uniref:PEP-CTERM sorting domain-containing protein n=1 Tax=Aquabacterium sp. TaxID=1872578 RepID=UPI003D6CB8B3
MHIAKVSLTLVLAMGLTAAHAQFAGGTPPDGSTPPGGTTSTSTGTLTDSSVTIGYFYNDLTTALASSTVTVGSAVEVSCPDATLNLCASTNATGNGLLDGEYIDVGSTAISGQLLAAFTAASGDTYNGLVFSGLNFGDGYLLTGFTLTTNISGLDASDISFTSTSLSMNLLGIDPSVTTDGTSLGTFSVALQVSAVPEPSSALLMLLGIPLLAGVRLRRNSQR